MAKRVSGERRIKVGTKTYTLRLDFAALADIEDSVGGPITDYLQKKAAPKLSELSTLFASLAHIEPEAAWGVIQEYGMPETMQIVTEVIVSTLMPEDAPAGKPTARQRKTTA